ncbi:MAG: hypothetical protein ACJ8AS_13390 [Hyphomicrobiales bacterium]
MTKLLSILICAAPLAFAAPVLAQSTAGEQPDVAASTSKPATAKLMLLARHGADDGANHDKGDDRGGRRDGKGRGGNDDGPNHA